MIKINELDSNVYNKISAGEVVERPRSIVKELVENSIDAGATNIYINIEDGGITSIEISDNGVGINADYVRTAFLPHATSKLVSADDLDNISTLGFRGEALSSIAAVSIIELVTQAIDERIGTKLVIRGGAVELCEGAERDHGATIKVKDLFFNTPARRKFLKTAKGEEQEITSQVEDLILANPNVSFSYYANDKSIYVSRGVGLHDAIYSIYDRTLVDNLIEVDSQVGDINIKGYVSKPEYTKSNRSYQTLIINGRNITNTQIATAVTQAYGVGLMRRAFPVFILDITMPFKMLDVNVTPSKSDVRFSDSKLMFSKVYTAIKRTLDNAATIFNMPSDKTQGNNESESVASSIHNVIRDVVNASSNTRNYDSFAKKIVNKNENKPNNEQSQLKTESDTNTKPVELEVENTANNTVLERLKNMTGNSSYVATDTLSVAEPNGYTSKYQVPPIQSFINSSIADNVAEDNFINAVANDHNDDFKVIGQIFDTYLLVNMDNSLFIIDQHASHERLIYDKLIKQIEDNALAVQPLLFPQTVTLSSSDCSYMLEIAGELKKIGIEIDEFGTNTIKVSQLPIVLQSFKLSNFVDEILANKNKWNGIRITDILKDKLAITACKAAIKGGDRLNDYEIKCLLKLMKDNLPLQCPHGRPAIIRIERKDIDKLFKRIL